MNSCEDDAITSAAAFARLKHLHPTETVCFPPLQLPNRNISFPRLKQISLFGNEFPFLCRRCKIQRQKASRLLSFFLLFFPSSSQSSSSSKPPTLLFPNQFKSLKYSLFKSANMTANMAWKAGKGAFQNFGGKGAEQDPTIKSVVRRHVDLRIHSPCHC